MKQISFLLLIYFTSCIPFSFTNKINQLDYIPPIFEKLTVKNSKTFFLQFDEKCNIKDETLFVTDTEIETWTSLDDGTISITLATETTPGKLHKLNVSVSDLSGNTISLITEFYGFNPNIPELILNEIRTSTSDARPANMEIYCKTAGNLAGVTIYTGTENSYKNFFIFPEVKVSKGDYVVVHFKPEGVAAEKQEIVSKNLSGGREASSTAFDFWVNGGTGISKSNGAVSIYTTKNGDIIDCFIYSSRTSESDTKYRGFGTTATLTMIEDIEIQKKWNFESDYIKPEDCINPMKSTTTRTICRRNFVDTDSKDDWYICADKASSIGYKNSATEYSE